MSVPLDEILSSLMHHYQKQVPDVKKMFDKMLENGLIERIEDIENDHIAFRTLGLPSLGIASLEKIFLAHGYQRKDPYTFEKKKLKAFWYAPPKPHYPRIFISELEVDKLSPSSKALILRYTQHITKDPVDDLDLNNGKQVGEFLHQALWPCPNLEDYESLEKESEYASWVIFNRFYLNHFTISVHNLLKFNTLKSFVEFLESYGFVINDAGGKIKVSEDKLLLQGSTVAAKASVTFKTAAGEEVQRKISTSYVEFAQRLPLPEYENLEKLERHHRREGFETQNADGIFESTYQNQTKKRS